MKVGQRFKMKRFGIIVLIFLGLGAAGVVFLASWDIPAPTKTVSKVVPNETFNR